MACAYCNHKGYLIHNCLRNVGSLFAKGESESFATICPKCNDVKAYSKYVKEEIFGYEYKPEKPIVIDFAKTRKKEEMLGYEYKPEKPIVIDFAKAKKNEYKP